MNRQIQIRKLFQSHEEYFLLALLIINALHLINKVEQIFEISIIYKC
jgi:hypothetical protein